MTFRNSVFTSPLCCVIKIALWEVWLFKHLHKLCYSYCLLQLRRWYKLVRLSLCSTCKHFVAQLIWASIVPGCDCHGKSLSSSTKKFSKNNRAISLIPRTVLTTCYGSTKNSVLIITHKSTDWERSICFFATFDLHSTKIDNQFCLFASLTHQSADKERLVCSTVVTALLQCKS